jgi:hypothetical protein
MISSVNSTTQTAQLYQTQHHQQNIQAHKDQQKEPQDTVVLSKQATGTGDVDHDGDNR